MSVNILRGNKMRIWGIKSNGGDAGNPRDMMQTFLDNQRCYVRGGEVAKDFSKLTTKIMFKKALKEAQPDKNAQVEMNWNFCYEIHKGDIIVVPHNKEILYIGTIISDYEFDDSKPQQEKHSRKVKWFDKKLSKAQIGTDNFNNVLTRPHTTICDITKPDALQILKEYYYI